MSDGLTVDSADLTAHAEVDDESVAAVQRAPDEFSASNRRLNPGTRQRGGEMRGASRMALECAGVEYRDAGHTRADEMSQKSPANNLDLGKFWHWLSRQLGERVHRGVGLRGLLARPASRTESHPVTRDRRVELTGMIGAFRGGRVDRFAHGVTVAVFL